MPKAKASQKLSQGSAISQSSNKGKKPNLKAVAQKKSPATSISANKTQKGSKKLEVKTQKSKVPIKGSSKKIQKVDKKSGLKANAVTKKNSPAPVFGKKASIQDKSVQPKKAQSSYTIFSSQMQNKMKTMPKFKDLSFSDRSKVVGESWGKLSDEQKQQYVQMANEDKKRYAKELKQLETKGYFTNKDGKKITSEYQNQKKSSPKNTPQPGKKIIKDDVQKPKQALSGYIYFCNQNREAIKKQYPELSLINLSKKFGEQWKNLSEKQKEPFEKLHEKDVFRNQKETQQLKEDGYFINSDGIKSTFLKKGKAQEFEVGTVMPKQAKKAYIMFLSEYCKNNDTKGAKSSETVKVIAEQWKNMSEKQKEKYDELSKKDHERYQNQLNEIRKKGFFINENGVKSTDLLQKQKRARKSSTKK